MCEGSLMYVRGWDFESRTDANVCVCMCVIDTDVLCHKFEHFERAHPTFFVFEIMHMLASRDDFAATLLLFY